MKPNGTIYYHNNPGMDKIITRIQIIAPLEDGTNRLHVQILNDRGISIGTMGVEPTDLFETRELAMSRMHSFRESVLRTYNQDIQNVDDLIEFMYAHLDLTFTLEHDIILQKINEFGFSVEPHESIPDEPPF